MLEQRHVIGGAAVTEELIRTHQLFCLFLFRFNETWTTQVLFKKSVNEIFIFLSYKFNLVIFQ